MKTTLKAVLLSALVAAAPVCAAEAKAPSSQKPNKCTPQRMMEAAAGWCVSANISQTKWRNGPEEKWGITSDNYLKNCDLGSVGSPSFNKTANLRATLLGASSAAINAVMNRRLAAVGEAGPESYEQTSPAWIMKACHHEVLENLPRSSVEPGMFGGQ
jgi:hypothetical protein